VHVVERKLKIENSRKRLELELGREPTLEEIMTDLELTREHVVEADRAWEVQPSSLNLLIGFDQDAELGDKLSDKNVQMPEEEIEDSLRSEQLDKLLATLKPIDRLILELRFGLNGEGPLTLEAIGERTSLTRERVRQRETEALKKLKASNEAQWLRSEGEENKPLKLTRTAELLMEQSGGKLDSTESHILEKAALREDNFKIARQLGISERALRSRLITISLKLGYEDKEDALSWARRFVNSLDSKNA
jgi:RNA polymerase sigma factor (sigma-70 family)